VGGEQLGVGVAAGRLLLQALQADRLQVARRLRVERTDRNGFLAPHLFQRVQRRRPAKGPSPGQQLVEDGAQRVHVAGGAAALRLPRRPLRGPVGRGAVAGRRSRPKSVILGTSSVNGGREAPESSSPLPRFGREGGEWGSRPPLASRTLAGFRSRWTMPRAWAAAIPRASCSTSAAARRP